MPILTKQQLLDGYYRVPDSFMQIATQVDSAYTIEQVSDYKGQDKLLLVCTQTNITVKRRTATCTKDEIKRPA